MYKLSFMKSKISNISQKNTSEPPRQIPSELYNGFTMNGTIDIIDWYCDDSNNSIKIPVWSNQAIQGFIDHYTFSRVKSQDSITNEPYPGCSKLHVEACEKYSENIKNKSIAVIGSMAPWIEAILINAGAKSITTVEYNVPQCNHNIIKTISYNDFCFSNEKYDSVFSFSSIEHSGLGRYGDPLNPNGDIETMNHIHNSLKEDGMIFIGFPVGRDCIAWNAHRIYGPKRLELIFKDFDEIEWIGLNKDYIYTCPIVGCGPQPLIVLKKKAK